MPLRSRAAFIRANLAPRPVPGCPGLDLYVAHPASGLARLEPVAPPFWAWPWPGGLALARHILENPHIVAGRSVLDLGSGSGLVAIAAARAGASRVVAADTDRFARSAARVNAALNGVTLSTMSRDLLDGPPPPVDVILAGDLFYDRDLARRALGFLRRACTAGREVLLGDILRPSMDARGWRRLAVYPVRDVGDSDKTPPHEGGVFAWTAGGDQFAPSGSIES